MSELDESVTEALAPETFDVLDFVQGRGLPRSAVTLYTDVEAGQRLADLAATEESNAKLAEKEGLGIADEVEWVDPDEVEELRERIENSAITFKLRGLAPAAKKALRNGLVAKHNFKEDVPANEQEAYFEEYSYTLIAKTVEAVVRADGAEDNTKWTPERVKAFHEAYNETEYARLDNAVYNINFNTDVFDRAASADFLSKR